MAPHESDREPPGSEARPAYAKPAIAWEQPLGAPAGLASACGKIGGAGEPCDSAPAS